MRSRMAPQDEGVVLFDVDNIPISAILRSLFTQEGTLPERSVAGWGGGACAGGVPLRRPGRPPESGLAHGLPDRAKAKSPLRRSCELARPGLRRGRVRERLKARRRRAFPHGPAEGDGERRSGGEILSALREVGFRPRRQTGATLRAGLDGTTAPGTRTLRPKGWRQPRPGERRGNLPPWDRWGNSPDAGRTLRAGEQDGSAQNRRARSAGSSPIAYKGPTARRSAPPSFSFRTTRAKAAGTRELAARPPANSARRIGPPAPRPHREEPCGFAWRLERRGFQRGQKPGPPRPRPSRRRPKRACSSG